MNKLPSVAIVLATYKPNIDFLKQQLISLNNQTYSNLKLYVLDDGADKEFRYLIKKMLKEYITDFEYEFDYNRVNLGSNKTFEKLTSKVNEKYIAYCDQDDIWLEEKITVLINQLLDEKIKFIYSDLEVIDKNNNLLAKSFRHINKRVKHIHGDNCYRYLSFRNSVTGCTLLMSSDLAKAAIPFPTEYYVHDHWLALFTSSQASIGYCTKKLVRYRIHDNNQIGASILKNIYDLDNYYTNKILKQRNQLLFIKQKFKNQNNNNKVNDEYMNIRIDFFNKPNFLNLMAMLSKVNIDAKMLILEISIRLLPSKLNSLILKKIKS